MKLSILFISLFTVLIIPTDGYRNIGGQLAAIFAGSLLKTDGSYVKVGIALAYSGADAAWDVYNNCYTAGGEKVNAGDCAFSVITNTLGMGLGVMGGNTVSQWFKRSAYNETNNPENLYYYYSQVVQKYHLNATVHMYDASNDFENELKKRDIENWPHPVKISIQDPNGVLLNFYTNGTAGVIRPALPTKLEKRSGYDGYDECNSCGGIAVFTDNLEDGSTPPTNWDNAVGWADYTPPGYNAPWWDIWQATYESYDKVIITPGPNNWVMSFQVEKSGFGNATPNWATFASETVEWIDRNSAFECCV